MKFISYIASVFCYSVIRGRKFRYLYLLAFFLKRRHKIIAKNGASVGSGSSPSLHMPLSFDLHFLNSFIVFAEDEL
jgi:hypothetical protein